MGTKKISSEKLTRNSATWFPVENLALGPDVTDDPIHVEGVKNAVSTNSNNTLTGTLTMSGKSIYEANASVAANATTSDIWSSGNYVTLTGGAVTFTDFADAPQAGVEVEVYCNAAHVFTDNANLEVDGDTSFTAVAGDRVRVRAKSTTVFTVSPVKKDGTTLVDKSIGVNQTWQDMTGIGGRASGANIQNISGKPIMVNVSTNHPNVTGPTSAYIRAYCDTTTTPTVRVGGVGNNGDGAGSAKYGEASVSFIVPNNSYYRIEVSVFAISVWAELR